MEDSDLLTTTRENHTIEALTIVLFRFRTLSGLEQALKQFSIAIRVQDQDTSGGWVDGHGRHPGGAKSSLARTQPVVVGRRGEVEVVETHHTCDTHTHNILIIIIIICGISTEPEGAMEPIILSGQLILGFYTLKL